MKKMKRKVRFYKSLLIEIIETLISICMYLDHDGHYTHNKAGQYMHSHVDSLSKYSLILREEKREKSN